MPRKRYSIRRKRRSLYSHRRRRSSRSSSRKRRYYGGNGYRRPLPPLEELREHHRFKRASGWKRPLPPIHHRRKLSDKRGSVDYIFSRRGSGQFHYPSRESRYSPWEKIKYKFVKDKRRWPPTFA